MVTVETAMQIEVLKRGGNGWWFVRRL